MPTDSNRSCLVCFRVNCLHISVYYDDICFKICRFKADEMPFIEFLYYDIQSTEQKSHQVNTGYGPSWCFVLNSQIPLIRTSSKLAARSQGGRCLATVALRAHPVGRTTSLDSLKISIPFESKSSCLSLFLHYYIQIKHFWQGLYVSSRASLLVQMVKNPLARQETWVQSLG